MKIKSKPNIELSDKDIFQIEIFQVNELLAGIIQIPFIVM